MKQPDLFKRRSRVRWLAPSVLLKSLKPILVSGLFTSYSDRREVQGVLSQGVVYRSDAEELWVDYVADTGDGFDATATVASLLAPETLTVEGTRTRAGNLLVLGGDEVYPTASMDEYKERFIKPFRAMLPCSPPDDKRVMVAIPGNHDWYDGLTAFQQVFCGGQWIGGWKTEQRRSYFACQLPHGWWLWGIDIQLDTYIDHPQVDYFKKMAAEVDKGDQIILCWAKPAWVQAGEEKPQAYDTLDYFQRNIVPDHARVRLSLTGDSHHYARYEAADGEQKITAGLGGAFLSATHHLPPTLELPAQLRTDPPALFDRRKEFPTRAASKRVRWGVPRAIYANGGFVFVPGLAYLGLAACATRARRPWVATGLAAAGAIGACVAFSKEKAPKDWGPGVAHGVAHVATALAATSLLRGRVGGRRVPVAGAAAVGAAVGPLLFSAYLLAADHIGLFGRNTNELFSALAIEGHKGFLRLHFQSDGELTVYPIKVDEVARWKPDRNHPTWPDLPDAPRFEADPAPVPTFIEKPFKVSRRKATK